MHSALASNCWDKSAFKCMDTSCLKMPEAPFFKPHYTRPRAKMLSSITQTHSSLWTEACCQLLFKWNKRPRSALPVTPARRVNSEAQN